MIEWQHNEVVYYKGLKCRVFKYHWFDKEHTHVRLPKSEGWKLKKVKDDELSRNKI